jgi:hypothetical protein
MRSTTLLLILLFLAGCVGTVQDAATPSSLQIPTGQTTFEYAGLIAARPISHNKIELEFFPAPGGSEISYKLYINSASVPVGIDPQSLFTSASGKLLYTVQNLNTNQEYKFKLVAQNIKGNSISKNEAELYARTFDNRVSNFNGVSKVSLVEGQTSSAIRVDWIAAPMDGIFTAGPYDTAHYEVSYISEIGGSGNINNPTYKGTDKDFVLVPFPTRAQPLDNPSSVVIENLAPNTRYFVQVRSINSLFQNYKDIPGLPVIPVSREVNSKVMSIKTEGAGSLFDFRQDNVILANALALDAFDKINVYWQAGSGSFTGYRIFIRKYDGTGDANVDDRLNEASLLSMTTSLSYINVPTADTSRRISGLENGSWYQVKVVLCKTVSCPVAAADSNAGIISEMRAIKVQPTLAAFGGINSIEPPGQFSERDVVRLRFDPPLVTIGYANKLEFYCVNPDDKTQMVRFEGNDPITASPVARCNGLYLNGTPPSIETYNSQKVNGLITTGAVQYCFAASPAIITSDTQIRLPEMVIRCSYPIVSPPTVSQFPGVKNACSISGSTSTVTWNLPTGGIYSNFRVYWKEKSSATKFSFSQAIAATAGYSTSGSLPASDLSYTVQNLIPGKTYQVGVLAMVDLQPTSPNLYSEYNLNVVDCVVPLPVATFKGFTRIFAVGPKLDGRFPNDILTKAPSDTSAIYEAINSAGVPFEVAMDSPTNPNMTLNFSTPPGREPNSSFSGPFDGVSEDGTGYAMSKRGIVSLAWEEVEMSFATANTLFQTNQPGSAVPRSGRQWGYKVFRSNDNKLTWKELTTTSGNIYSFNYAYQNRPGVTGLPKRMAFFTDYSVSSLKEYHDATNGRDVDRARVYYYRIVPIFNGQTLKYSNTNANIVKVTLPPPNMALVHRWMANRARCLELDKAYKIDENYSCPYNGIGSKPSSFPYRINETSLDQNGDLLVDRNELGCRYTRGDKVADPELGSSVFDLGAARRYPSDTNYFGLFKGFRTAAGSEDVSTTFRGCTGNTLISKGNTGTKDDYPTSFSADYYHLLQGDCIGRSTITLAPTVCSSQSFIDGTYDVFPIVAPGVGYNTGLMNCSTGTTANPSAISTRLRGDAKPLFVAQSEFLGVYYNTYAPALSSGQYGVPVDGPNIASLTTRDQLNNAYAGSSGNVDSQCSINLAAIDGSGYMTPRWISVNDLSENRIRFKGTLPNILNKTVSEVTEVNSTLGSPTTFYNGTQDDGTAANFKLPSSTLRSSSRYRNTTRLSRIFSSNSSKLPPLGRVSSDHATSICKDYWVEVGAASDNGKYALEAAPVSKRPLRRQEFVTASAWPETYDENTVNALETSTGQGSCNTPGKQNYGTNIYKGDLLSNRSAYDDPSALGSPLLTGSSPYQGLASVTDVYHTGSCKSRYGIQDLVGNVAEANSERIFCDYSQDQSMIGRVAGTWGGGAAAENQGTGDPSYQFFNSNADRYNVAVLKSGNIGGVNRGFEFRYRDGSPSYLNARPFVKISVDSGYCSVADNDPSTRAFSNNPFADFEGYWNPLYLPGGALNTAMIKNTQPDQGAVETWRNGDGRVMDFGPKGIAPALNRANSMAINDDDITATAYVKKAKYFNPVIGLPLKCANNSCKDPKFNEFNDNTGVTLSTLSPNITSTDDTATITTFPVGNSQVKNLGVSDFQYSNTGFNSVTVQPSGYNNLGLPTMITYVLFDSPTSLTNPEIGSVNFPSAFQPGETVEYYRIVWNVERGSLFVITSGGAANVQKTGRYTANFEDHVGPNYGNTQVNRGFRCAVMINEE